MAQTGTFATGFATGLGVTTLTGGTSTFQTGDFVALTASSVTITGTSSGTEADITNLVVSGMVSGGVFYTTNTNSLTVTGTGLVVKGPLVILP